LTKTEPIHSPPVPGSKNRQERAPVTRGNWIEEQDKTETAPVKQPAETVIWDIGRATRRHFSAEDKIRIVLEGLRGEVSIAEICRREGIASSMYYAWSKEFLEANKKRLVGDTKRAAPSNAVKALLREALSLKEAVADLTLENCLLTKGAGLDS